MMRCSTSLSTSLVLILLVTSMSTKRKAELCGKDSPISTLSNRYCFEIQGHWVKEAFRARNSSSSSSDPGDHESVHNIIINSTDDDSRPTSSSSSFCNSTLLEKLAVWRGPPGMLRFLAGNPAFRHCCEDKNISMGRFNLTGVGSSVSNKVHDILNLLTNKHLVLVGDSMFSELDASLRLLMTESNIQFTTHAASYHIFSSISNVKPSTTATHGNLLPMRSTRLQQQAKRMERSDWCHFDSTVKGWKCKSPGGTGIFPVDTWTACNCKTVFETLIPDYNVTVTIASTTQMEVPRATGDTPAGRERGAVERYAGEHNKNNDERNNHWIPGDMSHALFEYFAATADSVLANFGLRYATGSMQQYANVLRYVREVLVNAEADTAEGGTQIVDAFNGGEQNTADKTTRTKKIGKRHALFLTTPQHFDFIFQEPNSSEFTSLMWRMQRENRLWSQIHQHQHQQPHDQQQPPKRERGLESNTSDGMNGSAPGLWSASAPYPSLATSAVSVQCAATGWPHRLAAFAREIALKNDDDDDVVDIVAGGSNRASTGNNNHNSSMGSRIAVSSTISVRNLRSPPLRTLDVSAILLPRGDLHTMPGDCTHLCYSPEVFRPMWAFIAEALFALE